MSWVLLSLGLCAGSGCTREPAFGGRDSDAAARSPAARAARDVDAAAPATLTPAAQLDAAAGSQHEASTTDAAGRDSSADSSVCARALCEGFEGERLDAARWQLVTPNCSGSGGVSVDAAQAHTGVRSLRVPGAAGYCNHVFVQLLADGGASAFTPGAPFYLRFYVRNETALAAAHVTWLAMHDAVSGKDLRFGAQSQVLIWNRESDDATLPELSPAGIALSVALAPGRWHCVELALDSRLASVQTWVDGSAITGLRSVGAVTADVDGQWQRPGAFHPQPTDLRFGYESYGNDSATLWFDDIAVGTAPLGCAP